MCPKRSDARSRHRTAERCTRARCEQGENGSWLKSIPLHLVHVHKLPGTPIFTQKKSRSGYHANIHLHEDPKALGFPTGMGCVILFPNVAGQSFIPGNVG